MNLLIKTMQQLQINRNYANQDVIHREKQIIITEKIYALLQNVLMIYINLLKMVLQMFVIIHARKFLEEKTYTNQKVVIYVILKIK